ncbi:uncharacterized protein LOC116803961 isoform X2 [Drosophila mojavensis]|uniref:uncharacterized protein LOC116803961 isoform X2 n=1 Tax=Drosophila mojavensis TaxID=7230 RepID=UPI0013EECBA2|nr:uncharacterized protein LOC116803961 isoform X2 [Drosophila mojavensis]
MLIAIVVDKMDMETKCKWNESLDYSQFPGICVYRSLRGFANIWNHASIEFHGSRLQEMPVVERYEAAKRHGLCLNSLGKGHQACKSLYSKMSILLETSLHYYIGRRSGGDCNSTDVGDIIL